MRTSHGVRPARVLSGGLVAPGLLLTVLPTGAVAADHPYRVRLLDTLTVPAGTTESGMPFGGLSGLDHDRRAHTYVALSDDRSENGKARFYTLRLPFHGTEFAHDRPDVEGLTVLDDVTGGPFAPQTVDPESIRWTPGGRSLLWNSEGASNSGQPAFVRETSCSGAYVGELPLPEAYVPVRSADGKLVSGVRNNQALEGLTLTPDGRKAVTVTENALVQDGPAARPRQHLLLGTDPARRLALARPRLRRQLRLQRGPHQVPSVVGWSGHDQAQLKVRPGVLTACVLFRDV